MRAGPHLDLDGPGEVADVDKEGDVWAVAEVKVLIGEAVLELLDVAAGHDGDLLARLGSCWSWGGQERKRQRRRKRRMRKRGQRTQCCHGKDIRTGKCTYKCIAQVLM